MHSEADLFARELISSSSTKNDEQNILQAYHEGQDIISVLQHHDAIAGTESQDVSIDYATSLAKALGNKSNTTTGIYLNLV